MFTRHHRVHVRRGKIVIVIGIVIVRRNASFYSTILYRIRHPNVFCIKRSLMRIETAERIRTCNRTLGQIFRHDINNAAHTIRCKTFRYIALVNLNAVNFIDRNIIYRKRAIPVIDRNAIHKNFHVLAFHAANIDFTFAAETARLAHFHTT